MAKPHLALVAPSPLYGTVEPRRQPPRRRRNAEARSREWLSEDEVERLIKAARDNRNGHRDGTLILVAFSHGLRAAELVALRWDAVDLDAGRIHINRVKRSRSGVHDLRGRELRALRRLKREQEPASPYVFTSERGAPFTTAGVRKMVARLGVAAGFDFPLHPHMLRHAVGYRLANQGVDTRRLQEYLGHASITSTVRYTELAPQRFKGFWKD
jgi:integrase